MGNYVYTCNTGCALNADSQYFIVVRPKSSKTIKWGQNTSGSETNTPSNGGWSIDDQALYQNGVGGPWRNDTAGVVKLMKVSWKTPTAPGKVDGLTAAAGNNQSIDLNWTAVTGANGYKVQYKSGSQNWSSTRQVSATINSRNLDNNLLTANTAYTFRVAATNAVGDGAWSDEVVATPVNATLAASGVGANSATLTIANHTGTWYYKRIMPTNGTCSSSVSTTSATVSLSSGLNHTFSAYNDNQCTGTVLATTPPFLAKPGKAAGVTANAANAALDVSWTATTGASSYKIQWKSSSDTGWDTTNRQTTSTNASATISSLTNATTYTVRVAAVNDAGDGAWSDTATGTPSGAYFHLITNTLTAGGAQFALRKSDGSFYTGTWYSKVTPPANATCETNSIYFKQLTGKSSATSYTITAYSDSSCAIKLTSLDFTTLPAKVAGLTATARNAALEVGWTATTGASSYEVQWKSGAQGWDFTSRQVVTTQPRAMLTGLTNNTQYTIRVRAANAGGNGQWSDNATGTPSATALTLTVTPAANGAFFSLSNHTGNFYYKVTPPSNANCDDGSTLTGNPRTFVDYTKSSGTEHNITVYSDAACSTQLTSVDFTTLPGKTTGVTLKNTGASLGVSWTAVTGATGYKVQWKSSSDTGWDATNRQTTSTTISATIPSLTNNTAYTVRVAAGNSDGRDGAWSDTVTETPSVTLTAGNVTSTGATLTVAGHTGTVYLSARGGGSYSLACTAVSGGTHSPTLQGNTTYEFKAYSNSSCTGTALAATSFTTPGAVTLKAINIGQQSVTLYLDGWRSLPKTNVSLHPPRGGEFPTRQLLRCRQDPRLCDTQKLRLAQSRHDLHGAVLSGRELRGHRAVHQRHFHDPDRCRLPGIVGLERHRHRCDAHAGQPHGQLVVRGRRCRGFLRGGHRRRDDRASFRTDREHELQLHGQGPRWLRRLRRDRSVVLEDDFHDHRAAECGGERQDLYRPDGQPARLHPGQRLSRPMVGAGGPARWQRRLHGVGLSDLATRHHVRDGDRPGSGQELHNPDKQARQLLQLCQHRQRDTGNNGEPGQRQRRPVVGNADAG